MSRCVLTGSNHSCSMADGSPKFQVERWLTLKQGYIWNSKRWSSTQADQLARTFLSCDSIWTWPHLYKQYSNGYTLIISFGEVKCGLFCNMQTSFSTKTAIFTFWGKNVKKQLFVCQHYARREFRNVWKMRKRWSNIISQQMQITNAYILKTTWAWTLLAVLTRIQLSTSMDNTILIFVHVS